MSIEMWLAEDDNAAFRSELQRKVFDEFAWEPMLDDADISVSVDDHVVTLSGAVKSYPQKREAEYAAKRVRGVRVVRNGLAVVLPAANQRSDLEIGLAAIQVLEADVLVPHDAIRVTVAGAHVRLEGQVRRDAERRAAGAAMQRLVGVKGVANEITIAPTTPREDLSRRAAAALQRCPGLRGDHVAVELENGTLALRGRVRSLAEREEAQQAVRALPGVTTVRDELQIEG